MKKQQIWGLLILLLVTGMVVWSAGQMQGTKEKTTPEGDSTYVQLLAATPVAQVEGAAVSPDGRYEVRAVGATDQYVSGVRPPEFLQIVERETEKILWEDMGYLWQSVSWSPDGKYLALAYAGRTWNQVVLFETESWTSWQFALPDCEPIPEYTFLPRESWGTWTDENTIRLTVGQGGDGEEQRTYRCSVVMEDWGLSGSVLEETSAVLDGDYDFDHDGEAEVVEIVTLWSSELSGQAAWYELRIGDWRQEAAEAHVGWTSIFALEINGEDYLLRYNPYMGQGMAYYGYQIFSLDEHGEEVLLKENSVEFDVSFGSPVHQSFDVKAIAAFLEEVHGYLDESTLLMSTEDGVLCTGGSGAEFEADSFCGDWLYHGGGTIEENLRAYEETARAVRAAEDPEGYEEN